jgi:L,D-transpeptidase YcbB
MKKNILRICATLAITVVTASLVAQTATEELKRFAASYKPSDNQLNASNSIKKFYELRGYRPAWIGNPSGITQLFMLLSQSEELGLDSADYRLKVGDLSDSIHTEVLLTDVALRFFNDLAYGNQAPAVGYNGINYSPSCYDIPLVLSSAVDNGTVSRLAINIQPVSLSYISLQRAMNILQKKIADTALREKLETDAKLKARMVEIKRALNTQRWLACAIAAGPVIVVNIPSANLLVYEHNNVILESKIIVGKRTTRTPTLISRVDEVILYPYWMVPKSIATKELLPLIKKNPGYLDRNAMQVLNQQGKVLNPKSINWNSLSTSNFPYVLRQSTGCDNSLGLIKINFYNPYTVYLHDTPWKVLFASKKRYYSHGCMRVEKAMELAHLLLKDNTIAVDTLEEKGCLLNQAPVHVPATIKAPVFVLYNTAWVDSASNVNFFEDVYRRFAKPVKKS